MIRGFTRRPTARRTAVRAGVWTGLLPVLVVLAGCSADDVQFEGKIFDAIGMNNPTQQSEPKMKARAPLVVPPNLNRIPEPGTPPESLSSDLAALNDPDQMKKASHAALERQQAEYCKVHYEQAKARGDSNADLASGPLGECRTSAITAFQNWSKGDAAEGQLADE